MQKKVQGVASAALAKASAKARQAVRFTASGTVVIDRDVLHASEGYKKSIEIVKKYENAIKSKA